MATPEERIELIEQKVAVNQERIMDIKSDFKDIKKELDDINNYIRNDLKDQIKDMKKAHKVKVQMYSALSVSIISLTIVLVSHFI